jgi:hypothetical protein
METMSFKQGHLGASLSNDGKWFAVAKMTERWAWLMLNKDQILRRQAVEIARTCILHGAISNSLDELMGAVLTNRIFSEGIVESDGYHIVRFDAEVHNLPFCASYRQCSEKYCRHMISAPGRFILQIPTVSYFPPFKYPELK